MKVKPLMLAAAVFAAACGGGTEFPSGEYEGTVTSESSATAHVRASLVEVQGAISGRWETDGDEVFDPRAIYLQGWWHEDEGVAELDVSSYGNVPENPVVIPGLNPSGACSYRLEGPLDGARITGTYFTHGCDDETRGTFDLARR
jgi:hypothetical protein